MKKNIKKALALLIAVQMLMMSQQSFAQPELNQVRKTIPSILKRI